MNCGDVAVIEDRLYKSALTKAARLGCSDCSSSPSKPTSFHLILLKGTKIIFSINYRESRHWYETRDTIIETN